MTQKAIRPALKVERFLEKVKEENFGKEDDEYYDDDPYRYVKGIARIYETQMVQDADMDYLYECQDPTPLVQEGVAMALEKAKRSIFYAKIDMGSEVLHLYFLATSEKELVEKVQRAVDKRKKEWRAKP